MLETIDLVRKSDSVRLEKRSKRAQTRFQCPGKAATVIITTTLGVQGAQGGLLAVMEGATAVMARATHGVNAQTRAAVVAVAPEGVLEEVLDKPRQTWIIYCVRDVSG
jgi:hypothetical protein